jgi:hypothetical protein
MNKFLAAAAALFAFVGVASAQTLPAGYLGTVTGNTPNTWQTFTYTFTPSTTGANFIGFAFRQDPAFWTFDNVSLTASGSSTNLLTNGAFTSGGSINVTTTNGPSSIQAPTNWGVWYQNGTYPAAAGTWQDIGGTNGGVWYDGAVGTFDGIYQGIILQAGTTYTITFDVSGNNTADTGPVQLGIYGGACDNVSLAASSCTIPSSVGFTTLATPAEGASAGNPTPTLVSSVATTPTSTSTTTYGTPTVTTQVVDASTNDRVRFTVTRTTTPITSTPFTTTTTTTPQTLETYSDGSTVTVAGTPTTSTTTGVTLTTGSATTTTRAVSSAGTKDAISHRNMNLFLIDPLSTRDGVWATPMMSRGGGFATSGAAMGWQRTIDNNTFGFALNYTEGNSKGYAGSDTSTNATAGTAYILSRQPYLWFKGAVGFSSSNHQTTVSIPEFALTNTSKIRQNNIYGDFGIYSPVTFYGLRPLAGILMNTWSLNGSESGSVLLSSLPANGNSSRASPYVGTRYEFNDTFALESKVLMNTDYKTVISNRLTASRPVTSNVSLNATIGFDRGVEQKYNNVYGLIGLKVAF